MYTNVLTDAKLFDALTEIDREMAATAQAGGCRRCAGRLDHADYPRKPRGGPPQLSAAYDTRTSFCCACCRKRLTEGLDSPYVFCHLAGVRVGKRLSYGGFYKAWQRAVRAAGVARVPHDFRRTAIRNLERDGVPRSVAMAMVGQKAEEVYRRYAIVGEAMIREAAIKMNRGAKTRRATAQRTAEWASSDSQGR